MVPLWNKDKQKKTDTILHIKKMESQSISNNSPTFISQKKIYRTIYFSEQTTHIIHIIKFMIQNKMM